MIYCRSCGRENKSSYKYCMKCGTDLYPSLSKGEGVGLEKREEENLLTSSFGNFLGDFISFFVIDMDEKAVERCVKSRGVKQSFLVSLIFLLTTAVCLSFIQHYFPFFMLNIIGTGNILPINFDYSGWFLGVVIYFLLLIIFWLLLYFIIVGISSLFGFSVPLDELVKVFPYKIFVMAVLIVLAALAVLLSVPALILILFFLSILLLFVFVFVINRYVAYYSSFGKPPVHAMYVALLSVGLHYSVVSLIGILYVSSLVGDLTEVFRYAPPIL